MTLGSRVYIYKVKGLDLGRAALHGKVLYPALAEGLARLAERTLLAEGMGHAHQGPEVHDGLVVEGWLPAVEHLVCQHPELALSLRGVDGGVNAQVARQYPIDIAVEDGRRLTVGKRGNGCCRVVTHPGQSAQFGKGARKPPTVLAAHHLSCLVQVACPGIVPQSLPEEKDLVLRSLGQRYDIGKTLHEAHIVVMTLCHAGLLKDDFRNPYPIGICRVTPGQFTTMACIPRFELFCEKCVHNPYLSPQKYKK